MAGTSGGHSGHWQHVSIEAGKWVDEVLQDYGSVLKFLRKMGNRLAALFWKG